MSTLPVSSLKLKARAAYLVPPPRILVRSNHYYLEYYIKGNPKKNQDATGIPAATTEADPKERRIIETRLQEAIDAVVNLRAAVKLGIRKVDAKPKKVRARTWQQLLEEFNEENRKWRGSDRAPKTLKHRATSVKYLTNRLPNSLPSTLTQDDIYALRDRSEAEGLSPASLRGYFVDLRSMMKYALSKRYIQTNPFDNISVTVPDQLPQTFDDETFATITKFLFTANRGNRRKQYPPLTEGIEILKPLLIVRFTLIRPQDVLKVDLEKNYNAAKHELLFWNGKGKRWEIAAISEAAALVLSWCTTGSISTIKTATTLNTYLTRACVHAGAKQTNVYAYKEAGSNDLDETDAPDRIVTLAIHHVPSGQTRTFQKHYSRSKKLLLHYLNEASSRHLPLLKGLSSLPPDPKEYIFSNPKAHDALKKAGAISKQKKIAT